MKILMFAIMIVIAIIVALWIVIIDSSITRVEQLGKATTLDEKAAILCKDFAFYNGNFERCERLGVTPRS